MFPPFSVQEDCEGLIAGASAGRACSAKERVEDRVAAWPSQLPSRGGKMRSSIGVAAIASSLGILLVTVHHCGILWRTRMVPRPSFPASALGLVSNDSLAHHLLKITAVPHIAGTPANMETAALVASELQRYGFHVHTADFPALLGYPGQQRVSILSPHPFNLSLREASFEADPYSQDPRASTPFLGYSPSGSVTARVVYANYGTTEDFELLEALGVSCQGLVVIMRYGEIYRGDKVANAAKHGAAGAILYSDPQQQAKEGILPNQTYPNTRYLPDSGVQRGSIIGTVPGDPRTPGWPSCDTCEALTKEELERSGVLPSIPAVPISYGNAKHILRDLGGPEAPHSWRGALPSLVYRLGPGPVTVALEVESNITVATVRDVIGVLKGAEEPDRLVVVGNHRDAWVFGAADPNSGTACLLELARALQELSALGWVPRRTVVLASWDGEEHNLVGSTEWVERNLPVLSTGAVAYLNLDVAVAGPGFFPAATPQLDDLVRAAAGIVQDPDGPPGQSVLDSFRKWSNRTVPNLDRLGGGGSDFASFLQHAGIASADFSFGGDYPMYHSLYDNFNWMSHFGDPLFKRHVAATQILLAMVVNLTSEWLLPLNYSAYAVELKEYTQILNFTLAEAGAPPDKVTLAPLFHACGELEGAALHVAREAEVLRECRDSSNLAHWESRLNELNTRLILAERGFLDPMGLGPDFSWYKHLIYGPEKDNGYGTDVFPALQDALRAARVASRTTNTGAKSPSVQVEGKVLSREKIARGSKLPRRRLAASNPEEEGSWDAVQHEIQRASRAIVRVAEVLRGQLQ